MHCFTSEKIRHYVLSNLLCSLGLHIGIEDLMKQTHRCDSFFSRVNSILLQKLAINSLDTKCELIYWVLLGLFLSIKTWYKQKLCVSWFIKIKSDFLQYLINEKISHYMFANLQFLFWVHWGIEQWFKQKHCGSCVTNINSVLLQYLTSEKIRHYVLANLLC